MSKLMPRHILSVSTPQAQALLSIAKSHKLIICLDWVGHLGLIYVIDITIADFTTLRNRMIMLTLNGTPTIISTFAAPKIVEDFLDKNKTTGWRTCFWVFAIVLVVVSIPAFVVMLLNQIKAKRAGLLVKNDSGRTPMQRIKYYAIEFDCKQSAPKPITLS